MNKEEYSQQQQLIQAILSGGQKRDHALKHLFNDTHAFEVVQQVIENGGGNDNYTRQIFKECLVEFDQQVRRYKYKYDNFSTFLEEISRVQWIKLLSSTETARSWVLNTIGHDKQLEGKIHSLIIKNSGSLEDAQDTYQNGLIQIDKQMKEGKFRGGAVKGFFYQVCFNLWRNELKKNKMQPLSDDGMELHITEIDPQKVLERKEYTRLLDEIFNKIGDKCHKILRLKYFVIDQLDMEDIAMKMGFKNAQIASNTLSKCRKKLWELLQDHKPELEWIRTK